MSKVFLIGALITSVSLNIALKLGLERKRNVIKNMRGRN